MESVRSASLSFVANLTAFPGPGRLRLLALGQRVYVLADGIARSYPVGRGPGNDVKPKAVNSGSGLRSEPERMGPLRPSFSGRGGRLLVCSHAAGPEV